MIPTASVPCAWAGSTPGWVLASETPALDIVGARFVRELEPGEMVVIDASGTRSLHPFAPERVDPKLCLFEFVYFARPDSRLYNQTVHSARQRMGEELADQAPVKADMVMPVPESGIPAAEGFARRSGIPFGHGLVKNRYIGRTFIAPSQEMRNLGVRMKLNPIRENIAGKRLVVVDDSIVRGTTQRAMVRMLREAGALEVHLRISSPPYKWPCFYGMDTGSRTELLAADLTVDEVRDYLGCDTLALPRARPSPAGHRRRGCRLLHGLHDRRLPDRRAGQARQPRSRGDRPRPPLWVRPTRRRVSASGRARPPSTASRRRCARRSGPRSSATSAASAACSPSTRRATASPCSSRPPTGSAPRR